MEFEHLQQLFSKIPKENRYNLFLRTTLIGQFLIVEKGLKDIFNESKEFTVELLNDSEIIELLESIPSLNVRAKILYELLRNPKRPIHIHDSRDLDFLATAIPYCDVVITEKTWKHSAKLHKLDVKYSTAIENDLNYLLKI